MTAIIPMLLDSASLETSHNDADERPTFDLQPFNAGRRGLPPSWHVGQMTIEGSIVVSSQAVDRRNRNPVYKERTDLAPLRGTSVGLKQSAIEYILGLDSATRFRELVEYGVLREHPETKRGVGRFYQFDPAWTLQDLHDRWVDQHLLEPQGYRDFQRYRHVRRACRIPADDPIPAALFQAAVKALAELGYTDMAEINGFLPLGQDAIERCEEVRKALSEVWRSRTSQDVPHIDRQTVLDTYPELGAAKRTNLMSRLGHESIAPPPDLVGQAWLLGSLRRPLILLLYVLAAKGKRRDEMVGVVHSFRLMEEVFTQVAPGGDPLDQDTIDLVVGTFAFGHLDRKVRPTVREDVARTFMWAVNWLRRWIKGTGGPTLQHFGCAQVTGRPLVLRELRACYAHLRPVAMAERQRRSSEAASRFVTLQEIAYLRKEGVCDTAAVARRAVREMGDAPCVKFSVLDRVIGPDGSLTSGAQRNDWIIWRRPDQGGDLPDIAEAPTYSPPQSAQAQPADDGDDGLDEMFAVNLDDYILEFLGSSPVIGANAYDPWYITCMEHCTWMAPAMLHAETQEARHRLMREWCLPSYPSTPAGLLRFGTSDSALFRRMMAKRRTIFPLGQFEMAIRYAHLALRAIVESFCRSGEFRQMEHRKSRWPIENKGGVTQFAFTAFRKMADFEGAHIQMDEYRVSEQTHDEAMILAEAVIARCHAETGQLPDIDPPARVEWKCDAGPQIFSWMGVPLQLSSLLVFLRYLLANTGEQFGFHDFRFASAKDANLVGLPMILIQETLKHAFPRMSEYYAHLTPELIASRTEDDLGRRRADAARRASYRNAA